MNKTEKEPTWEELDIKYPCKSRQEFNIPTFKSLAIPNVPKTKTDMSPANYLCGNSLGLMPKVTRDNINKELDAWAERGVESHFRHPWNDGTPWVDIDLPVTPLLAPIVGAELDEVAIMNSLTVNLNNLLVAFYKPTKQRYKILFESGAFPSDCYAFINQCKNHGIDPNDGLIMMKPREGEYILRNEDILRTIEENNESLALVCFPGIQYYTGQLFDIENITKFVVNNYPEISIGWDLAHAVGNVELKLHDWQVDFAVWCSYKYLNSGPGGIGGIFVHNKHGKKSDSSYLNRHAGWWGNNRDERFMMKETFNPIPGALGFRQSNPSVLDVVALKSSLEIFKKYGGIKVLRHRSIILTNYLKSSLKDSPYYFDNVKNFYNDGQNGTNLGFTIITLPENDESPLHGAQLSLLFLSKHPEYGMESVFEIMNKNGVIADERKPDVIRLTPAPLYNTFKDIYEAVHILNSAIEQLNAVPS